MIRMMKKDEVIDGKWFWTAYQVAECDIKYYRAVNDFYPRDNRVYKYFSVLTNRLNGKRLYMSMSRLFIARNIRDQRKKLMRQENRI